jgi:anti-anti-sigma factor
MALPCTSVGDCDVFSMGTKLTVNEMTLVAPELSRHAQSNPDRSVAIDLSQTEIIDSSAVRLLLNLKKHADATHARFVLLGPGEQVRDVLRTTNLDRVFTVLDSLDELEHNVAAERISRYASYAADEKGMRRLSLSCPVCGSEDVTGYLVDMNSYTWEWVADGVYPNARTKDRHELTDAHALLPIVCNGCYTCSLDIGGFNVLHDGKIAIPSAMTGSEKSLLAKSIKKRKKIIDMGVVIPDSFFHHPRSTHASFTAFLLAEACAQPLAVAKGAPGAFAVGYADFWALRYASAEQTGPLIDNCRTWITKAMSDRSACSPLQRAQSYYILTTAALSLDRAKEATRLYKEFASMVSSSSPAPKSASVNNPDFWFSQCENIWTRRVGAVSSDAQA